jgi:hypothetical protein
MLMPLCLLTLTAASPLVNQIGADATHGVLRGVDPCDLPLPDCPEDVTGDNTINVDDILATIGNFGEHGDGTARPLGDCEPTPNGDCVVTVNDLLAVISMYNIACLPTGACCDANESCQDLVQAECLAAGGTFMGGGTDCQSVPCGIAGDTCATAIDALNGSQPFDTTYATDSGFGDPDEGICPDTFLAWSGSPDVWFRTLIPVDGLLSVSLCDAASYDTSLVLYSGADCGNLTQIACNGDATGENGCQPYYSAVYDLPVLAGDTISIRIGGWNAETGPGTLTLAFAGGDPPAACCLDGACIGDMTMAECNNAGGHWFPGEWCFQVYCPQPYTPGGCDVDENVDFPCVCLVDGDDSSTDCPTQPLVLGQSICGTSSVYTDSTGVLSRDLDWWQNDQVDAGGTFMFTIGANSTCLILLVNLNTGTVDYAVDHAAGHYGTASLTLPPAPWGILATVDTWNPDWTCGSGLETYTLRVE